MTLRSGHLACLAGVLAGALMLAACGGSSSSSSSSPAATATTTAVTSGPEGVALEPGPDLAPASSTAPGTSVDGIQCNANEQFVLHIHAHLAVFVSGQSRAIPYGIGLPGAIVEQTPAGPVVGAGQCFYWLHTHASDGIIHIESPTLRVYTLGDFFDEWRQPLSTRQVGPAGGPVTAFVNGKRWPGSPRTIPLRAHAEIQVDVGTPVAPFVALPSFGPL